MDFKAKLQNITKKNNSLVCVGLDSEFSKIPQHLKEKESDIEDTMFVFNKTIIDATHDLVCAYKPNSAFYEAQGKDGIATLKRTIHYLQETYPEIVVILDAKRADIGNTNEEYVKFAFDYLCADAITLHPYLGKEALKPFLERKDKGSIILCRTSNPGAGEFQDLLVSKSQPAESRLNREKEGRPLYQIVAEKVVREWNYNSNCGLVVGATYPEELEIVRRIVGDMPILIPGIGTQGGDVEKTVKAGVDGDGQNAIISSSCRIIFASSGHDFAQKAKEEVKKLQEEINKYRKNT